MSKNLKWIGGAAGWMYGGPLGAFIGYQLGKYIGKGNQSKETSFEMSLGLHIIPIVLLANVFLGIYYNLSEQRPFLYKMIKTCDIAV